MLLRYPLLAGATLLLAGSSAAQTISFQFPEGLLTAPVASAPYRLATADFNNDGHPDIAATCEAQNVVSVTLSGGNGTFAPAVAYAVQSGPQALVATDLNADGRPDLVVANLAARSLSVLLNTGTGTFGPASTLALGLQNSPTHLLAGDFTGDGRPDVVVGTGNVSIQVFAGNNTGSLTAQPAMSGLLFVGLASADLNQDGKLDLLLSQAGSPMGSIRPLYGAGNGTFSFGPAAPLPGAAFGTGLLAADFDQDGRLDLAQLDPAQGEVLVFLNSAAGLVAPAGRWPVGNSPSALRAADLDGDGRPELVVANEGSHNLTVLPGQAAGTFGPARHYLTSGGPTDVVVADFSGDGRPDLLSADAAAQGPHNLTLLLNQGGGLFRGPASANLSHYGSHVALADLNGDGRLDVAVTGSSYNNSVGELSVLLGLGDGRFGPAHAWGTSGLTPGWIVARDITGDNRPEILVTHHGNSTFTIYTNDGQGGFPTRNTQWIPRTGNGIGGVATADFNGDGRFDVAVAGAEPTYNSFGVDVFLNNNGQLGVATFLPTPGGYSPYSIEAADVDHDGRPDLVMSLPVYGGWTVGVMRNLGNNAFAPLVTYPAPNPTEQVLVADVNGDQWPDLLVRSGTALQLRLNLAGTGFGAAQTFPTASNSMKAQVADLNGDGLVDLLVSSIAPDRLQVFRNVNNSSFAALPELSLFGYGWDMAVGPLNGDALPDLVNVDLSGYSVVSFLNTSESQTLAATAPAATAPWRAYPNPATTRLHLPALPAAGKPTTGPATAALFDSRGTGVGRWELPAASAAELPVGHLARGLYFLRISAPGGQVLAAQQLVLE